MCTNSTGKVWGSTDDGKYLFVSLTTDLLEGALQVYRDAFLPYESVCVGVEITTEPAAGRELELLCTDAAQDGASLVAVHQETGIVAAVAFNKIQIKGNPGDPPYFETFIEKHCKFDNSIALIRFMIKADSRLDVLEHYGVDCLLEIVFLATLPDHRGRELGRKLCEKSIEMVRAIKNGDYALKPLVVRQNETETETASPTAKDVSKLVPKVVAGLFTSSISQKIPVKLNFDQLDTVGYDEFVFRGKTFSSRIGKQHPDSMLAAKRVN